MANCNCDSGLFNLQSGACIVKPAITRKFVFVEYFKADGTVNGIDLGSPFGETEIDALINQADKKLRWFLSDNASNFATERADPNTETIDNVNFITSQGTRTMTADFLASSAELAKKIDSNNCVDMGVYLIDEDNGISGILNRDGFLDPIRLERNAFGKVVFPNESAIFKVMFSSTWFKSVKDGDLKVLTFDEHQTDLLNKRGLVDVEVRSENVIDATTIRVKYCSQDGSATGSNFTGLLVGDFVVNNLDTSSTVTVSASVENPDGTYTLTIAAQAAQQMGEIRVSKAGFDFEVASVKFQ